MRRPLLIPLYFSVFSMVSSDLTPYLFAAQETFGRENTRFTRLEERSPLQLTLQEKIDQASHLFSQTPLANRRAEEILSTVRGFFSSTDWWKPASLLQDGIDLCATIKTAMYETLEGTGQQQQHAQDQTIQKLKTSIEKTIANAVKKIPFSERKSLLYSRLISSSVEDEAAIFVLFNSFSDQELNGITFGETPNKRTLEQALQCAIPEALYYLILYRDIDLDWKELSRLNTIHPILQDLYNLKKSIEQEEFNTILKRFHLDQTTKHSLQSLSWNALCQDLSHYIALRKKTGVVTDIVSNLIGNLPQILQNGIMSIVDLFDTESQLIALRPPLLIPPQGERQGQEPLKNKIIHAMQDLLCQVSNNACQGLIDIFVSAIKEEYLFTTKVLGFSSFCSLCLQGFLFLDDWRRIIPNPLAWTPLHQKRRIGITWDVLSLLSLCKTLKTTPDRFFVKKLNKFSPTLSIAAQMAFICLGIYRFDRMTPSSIEKIILNCTKWKLKTKILLILALAVH